MFNKRIIYPTPLDAHCELLHDNTVLAVGVPTVGPTGRDGQAFDLTGMPNGNGAQQTISKKGYRTSVQRGTLYTASNSLFDVDDIQLIPDGTFVDNTLPLHADGWDIFTSDNKRYVHKQCTNYLLFERYMLGQDITNLLYDGFDGYNVTFLMSVVPGQAGLPALRPENFPGYYQKVDAFLAFMRDQNKRIEGTLLCDCRQLGVDHNWQVNFTNQMYEIFRPYVHMVQLANEPENNDVDFRAFQQPQGIFWSRGSSLAGEPCPLPAGNYSTQHLSRNPGGDYLDAQPYYMVVGYNGYAGTHGPVITNETRGASDTENSGRRTTDPAYFRRIRKASEGWSGSTFHSDFSIHSDPCVPGSQQDKCRIAFVS